MADPQDEGNIGEDLGDQARALRAQLLATVPSQKPDDISVKEFKTLQQSLAKALSQVNEAAARVVRENKKSDHDLEEAKKEANHRRNVAWFGIVVGTLLGCLTLYFIVKEVDQVSREKILVAFGGILLAGFIDIAKSYLKKPPQ